ncbi:MAG: prepilin-type N-terminal cleavage/methylation domain-containing protein [Verrucomicrobia bacterium]|nr:prepilin-type N-terminal cleavage/methylation domain-containing protein [Verrucomicrobiota bacterium]MCH8527198.1 prepilin-type N-terminal cleavage/methylation domain-containing protein [Kiritimatiellia bacterium]
MKKTPSHKRSGFTLIEMLVVIAIIAILAGLLFPAINRALETAKRNQASADVRSIAAAITMFYNDYGYLPVPFGEQGVQPGSGSGDFGIEQTQPFPGNNDRSDQLGANWAVRSRRIIQVLTNETTGLPETWRNLNPRGKVFLSMQTLGNQPGEMLDPWGGQYAIKLDLDLNNMIEYYSDPRQHRTRSVVVSAGRSRVFAGGTNHRDNVANVEIKN